MEMKTSWKTTLLAGLIAGLVFGMMMQMSGKISVIAGLVGSSHVFVGWLIHMLISFVFAIFYLILVNKTEKYILIGIVHGTVIWIIGPLVIMPLMMGKGVMLLEMFSPPLMMSLVTHIFFSLMLAVVFKISRTATNREN
jgi:uncharacterized membrane protein YagU involved in acid resistance